MKSKKGISLIVLIITIIVVIILAAVVILTLSKNNPIESAKEAAFKEEVRTFQNELAMYISKDYTNKAGARDEKITATNYNPAGDPASVYTYIPSFSKKYENKFVIKNDELMYKEDMIQQEKDWCQSLNVKENAKTGAEKAKENPATYYGAKVTNYIANGISDWRIFYSDGNNVYLITSDYVDPVKLPSKNGKKPENTNSSLLKSAKFDSIISEYNGSSDIIDEKMKAFNSDYFDKNYTSTNNNMKAVAYMLDKDIWGDFVNTSVAEYAVGGPSVEMLLKSYTDKFPEKKDLYKARAVSEIGYEISKDGGEKWGENSIMLSSSDSLYVISTSNGEASSMWVSSPGNDSNQIIEIYYLGQISCNNYSKNYSNYVGFRPLVCLNSNILLNEVEGGYEISK